MEEGWMTVGASFKKSEIKTLDTWLKGGVTRNGALRQLILSAALSGLEYHNLLTIVQSGVETKRLYDRLDLARREFGELQAQRTIILSNIESLKKTEKEIFKRIARGIPIGPAIPLPVIPIVSIQKTEEEGKREAVEKAEPMEDKVEEIAAVEEEKKKPQKMNLRMDMHI